jgi:uncharacterized protein YjeT (DUF2065 family)
MNDLLTALAIALFLEGAAYALFPRGMKKALLHILAQPVSSLRTTGIVVAAVAVAAVWLLRA